MEIDIDAWAIEEAERLRAFVASWKENSAHDPDIWPAKMVAGEWDEQYRAECGA